MNANLLIFKNDPLNCFILAALCLILEKKRFLESEEKLCRYPISVSTKTIQSHKKYEAKCKKTVSGVEKALRLTLVLYVLGLLISTYHWANMPTLSFVPRWSWHSLQIEIWWGLQSSTWNGNQYKLKYKYKIRDDPIGRQTVFWWDSYSYLQSRRTRCPLKSLVSFISFRPVHALLPTRTWLTICTLKYTQTGQQC